MKYEYIGKGKTREEATQAAVSGLMAELAKAGVKAPNSAEFHEEVIALPKKKILGLFGGSDAEVKVCYDDGRKEKKPQQKKPQPVKKAEKPAQKPAEPKKAEKKAETAVVKEVKETAPAQKEAEEPITEKDVDINGAVQYLKTMIEGLKVEGAELSGKIEDGVLDITVSCDDYGIIIGRRGETLDSLQYLTSLAVKKACGKYVRVVLNVGNYREKRTETIKNLAQKHAQYVLRTGRRYTFEPMNPYERRIIHTTVQEIEGVESSSIGYGQDRRVVIQPVGGVKYHSGAPRRERRDDSRSSAKKANLPKDFTKFGKIEVNKD